jgi:2-amino-4-hydroxy-6-hydroxymethyldihydropteridine diphosphokinase
MKSKVYLGLGSNIGDRLLNLKIALNMLKEKDIRVLKISSVYETSPVDYLEQPDFLNIVVEAATSLKPEKTLESIREIESSLGRKREIGKGPRAIDIDILLYNKAEIRTADLTIPHPRMLERSFVIVPLLEIAPDVKLPSGELVRRSFKGLSVNSTEIRKTGKDEDLL